MIAKKSIVLSGVRSDKEKAVLSLEMNGESISGRVRLYNFANEPSGIISLGLFSNGKVIKAGLTKASTMLYTFQAQEAVLPAIFSCAIVNFSGGEAKPLLYGNSDGSIDQEDVFGAVIASLQDTKSASKVEQILDQHGVFYEDELQEEIDEAIEKEFEKHDCAHCKYRNYFYENHPESVHSNASVGDVRNIAEAVETVAYLKNDDKENGDERTDEDDSPNILPEFANQEQTNASFYDEIKPQVETLFEKNPAETYLMDMIPNSKWVKVEFDQGGDYYVFGMLYENDMLKYICYGVPGIYQKQPPKQLSGYPVWFPLDSRKREGFGYWLSYQDAGTGESIKAIVE